MKDEGENGTGGSDLLRPKLKLRKRTLEKCTHLAIRGLKPVRK
jgi:hypothetical protein